MDTSYLKSYYRRGSTYLTSEQIETIRSLKGKVPKYRIIGYFHINEYRVDDIWENRERQQQVIQNSISPEILSTPDDTEHQIEDFFNRSFKSIYKHSQNLSILETPPLVNHIYMCL